jgi:uncharacterized protein YbjT (DUF2867 family)
VRVLVTGGAGTLGRRVVPRLAARGHGVRVMTHSGRRVVGAISVTADLLTGEGIEAAVSGADCIVHLASSPNANTAKVDVEGTANLLRAASAAGVAHFVHMSITGVDRLTEYEYYRHKLEAEQVVQAGEVPWSIVRATQFYDFIDVLLRRAAGFPVMVVPKGFQCQPLDLGEVANRLVEVVGRGPAGMLPEMGGPEVFTAEQLAAGWRAAHNVHRPLVLVPVPGRMARKFRAGAITCPDHRAGRITWAQWLAGARG